MRRTLNELGSNAFLRFLTRLQASCKRRSKGFFMSLLCLCFAAVAPGVSHSSEATSNSWSFRFNDLPVEDALKQLSQITGVNVLANRPPDNRRLTRSYENQTVEQIVRDILRGVNYTLEWRTNEEGFQSVAITFIDGGSGGFRQSSGDGRTVERNSDYEVPQSKPQIRQQKTTSPMRPLAGNPKIRSTGTEPEVDDGEAESENLSEPEDDEDLSHVSEHGEYDESAGGAESEGEFLDEVVEDEEGLPSDHEEVPEELEQ
jgi:hypothetical protein